MSTFKEYSLSPEVQKAIEEMGFVTPSEIQAKAIPLLLSHHGDFVGQAQTGTGKTAAFGIPLIEKIDPSAKTVQAIILSPTRELAVQISEELKKLSKHKRLRILPIYGGQDIGVQLRALRQGVQIVVGTPGRVVDHLHRGTLQLSQIKHFVLDEADEMLDMGFLEEIEEILTHAGTERSIWLFSATLSGQIRGIAKRFMTDPREVKIQKNTATTENTEEIYYAVQEHNKFEALCRLIDHAKEMYAIVFCQTKAQCAEVAERLVLKGFKAEALHGDMNQAQREHVMRKFKAKGVRLLIATDVAARGIDVNDLTHVINYSLPMESESYIHRIGRTGRAGKTGIAITLVTPSENYKLRRLEGNTRKRITKSTIPGIQEIMEANIDRTITEFEEALKNPTGFDRYFDRWKPILKKYETEEIMRGLVTLLCREFLEKYEDDKELNVPDNFGQRSGMRDRSYAPRAEMTELRINVGAQHNLQTGTLVGKICNLARLEGRQVGKVFINEDHSVFRVDAESVDRVIRSLTGITIGGKKAVVERTDGRSGGAPRMPFAKRSTHTKEDSPFRKSRTYKKDHSS